MIWISIGNGINPGFFCMTERAREGGSERERERQTDTDRERERQTEREREKEYEKWDVCL